LTANFVLELLQNLVKAFKTNWVAELDVFLICEVLNAQTKHGVGANICSRIRLPKKDSILLENVILVLSTFDAKAKTVFMKPCHFFIGVLH